MRQAARCAARVKPNAPAKREGHFLRLRSRKSPHWGLSPGPSVYKTDALPLSYRGHGIFCVLNPTICQGRPRAHPLPRASRVPWKTTKFLKARSLFAVFTCGRLLWPRASILCLSSFMFLFWFCVCPQCAVRSLACPRGIEPTTIRLRSACSIN